jgi:hypothetical protein
VEAFAWRWYREVAILNNGNLCNIMRILEKEVISAIGDRQVGEVTVPDILAIPTRSRRGKPIRG